jgi:hypothetical protein
VADEKKNARNLSKPTESGRKHAKKARKGNSTKAKSDEQIY